MDPLTCCLLGICCAPEAQLAAHVALYVEQGHSQAVAARKAVKAVKALRDRRGPLADLIAALTAKHSGAAS